MNAFSLRGLYDDVAKKVTPTVEAAVHSGEFAATVKIIGRVRGAVGGKFEDLNASVLHLINLPAGSDIRKLRRQVGDLDYEVRKLRLDVAARDAKREEDKNDGADS